MKIIKLDAIDSTNDYLKKITRTIALESYTIVTAKYQTNGKGQMHNSWYSEKDKNLLFSILINKFDFKLTNPFQINVIVSLAVFDVISKIIPEIKIKWPNDIMSYNNKICGILTENIMANGKIKRSIIGIGLNVNQLNFSKELTKVTSISKELNNVIVDKEIILLKIINRIKFRIKNYNDEMFNEYHNNLFQFQKSAMYKNSMGKLFLGKIISVSTIGKLMVEVEEGKVNLFDFKEIVYL